MARRLATIFLTTTFLVGITSPARAQDTNADDATLRGIGAVLVLVEDLPASARILGLTTQAIQTDVELKLRLAGMRVVTAEESYKLPGHPYVYIQVNLTSSASAVSVNVDLVQDVLLERNGEHASGAITWQKSGVGGNQDAQGIRSQIKDYVDAFLNAWLSVNPKK